jgi:dihydrolipoamide dehydrogenase
VQVDGRVIEARHVLLATGSYAKSLPGLEINGTSVITSDEALGMDRVPASAIILGAGAIGCEFASVWRSFGSEVTIIEALPHLVPLEEESSSKLLERAFRRRGIAFEIGVRFESAKTTDSGVTVTLEGGKTIDAEILLVAVGRGPVSEGLGYAEAGVELQRGYVIVDEYCRTAVPTISAIGDLIPTLQLAHVGFAEGILVIKDILGEDPFPVDYGKVPWCIYCQPEVAFAGHSEESAKEAGLDVVVSKHRYAGNGRALIVGESDGLVKIIAEKGADGRAGRILGVHMVGPWVTEQLGQGYLAVNWEATVDEVSQFIQPHPTLSELFGESVMALTGRGLHG